MGRFDFPSPYWDSISDEALDLIDSMMQVDPKMRITVQDALKHSWTKGSGAGPADSCSNLANDLERLQFRRVKRERTLLAKAPGLVNPDLENPSKYQVKIEQKKDRVKDQVGTSNNPGNLDAQTAAFVAMGGKGGDEALFSDGSDSYYVVSQGGENGEN
jgi:serine/threonine-protein kinase Chk2